MAESRTHVVMLPWCAFGHLIPFFHLSISLAKSGVHVSFISTPRNIQRLPKPPSTLAHLLDLVELPLPSLDAGLLPEGAEATVDIPSDKEFQVKLQFFSVITASVQVFFGPPGARGALPSPKDLTVPPEWITFPSSVAYQMHEAIAIFDGAYQENVSGLSDIERFNKVFGASQAVLFRSCHEIEGEYLNLYQELIGKPRGKVCMGWAPQQEILAHPSIGVSFFHSGWGSVIENLQFGNTLVVLPFIVDQPLTARFLVEKGLAIEVKRNNEDGSFSRDDIAKSLREAMVMEEGEKLRNKTRDAANVVGDLKLHQDYMAEFVKFLKTGIWKQI
ncbi:hypothetical protein Ahy_A02g009896 [Arachis hypogaea]|uniref:UDP-glycosyltransferases domain-containing protein n=1 Tax=Arachis hypogaea TaxID=3818 RepID=A0A445EIE3_ARAHY|nr:hypothetical protein Ahy_A02g009896 [Arachis hypogaea]